MKNSFPGKTIAVGTVSPLASALMGSAALATPRPPYMTQAKTDLMSAMQNLKQSGCPTSAHLNSAMKLINQAMQEIDNGMKASQSPNP